MYNFLFLIGMLLVPISVIWFLVTLFKRRTNFKTLLLIVVGFALMLLTVHKVDVGDDDVVANNDNQTEVAEPVESVGSVDEVESVKEIESTEEIDESPGVGDSVVVKNLEVKVNGISLVGSVSSTYSEATPNTGNYLLVDVSIVNVGNEAQTIDTNNFNLVRGDTTYDPDSTATRYSNADSDSFFLNKLNPEASVNGTVAFDISESSANDPDLKLEISDNIFFGKSVLINLY